MKAKTKFKCAIFMGEECLNVYSNSSSLVSMLTQGNFIQLIPEYKWEFQPTESPWSLYFQEGKKFLIKIDKSKKTFYVKGPVKKLIPGDTLPYLIHYILEVARMGKAKLTAHGAGVSKNEKGTLILGKQGAGKTSVTIELCRKYGYSLIGNDLVLIGFKSNKGYLYGGTKIFRVRLPTVKYYNQDLKYFFKNVSKKDDEWTTIIYIPPKKLNIPVEKKPVPIKRIVYIHLYNDLKKPLCVKNNNLLFSRIYLHQNFSNYIRGSAIIPMIGKNLSYGGYLPSLDNPSFYTKRKKLIDWIIKNKNYKYVSGPISKICDYIDG